MKKWNLPSFCLLLFLMMLLTLPFDSPGQGRSQKHGPPPWAPAHGYRAKTRHIYFPNQNLYYDVQRNSYIYYSNGRWRVSVNLPVAYSRINLRLAPKVELDLDSDSPQRYNLEHRNRYKGREIGEKDDDGHLEKHHGKGKGHH